MPNPNWNLMRRLLVMRLDNIGDVVMTGPTLRSLKAALPSVHITLMATPGGRQITPLLPWIDDVIVQRVVWQDISGSMAFDPARELSLVEMLRSHSFDAALILTSFSQSPYPPAYLCYLAGIPVRVGQSKEFGGAVLSHWSRPAPNIVHQVDRNLALVEFIGLPVAGRELELRVPEEIQSNADRVLSRAGIDPQSPFVVMAPGASAVSRRYPADRFAAAANLLREATGMPVILLGSPREEEMVNTFIDSRSPVTSLVGETSVPEMAAVIRRSSLVIANNSASLHIADAFRRPMVILFSGTDLVEEWEPRNAPARLLNRPTTCSPCREFQCPYGLECLDIPPQEIAVEAVQLLAGDASSLHQLHLVS